jgi:hypothetical protein
MPTCAEVGERGVHANIEQLAFTPLVRAEEDDGAREGSQKGRGDSPIEAAPYALLSEDGPVARAHGRVFGRHVRIALLPCLDRVE